MPMMISAEHGNSPTDDPFLLFIEEENTKLINALGGSGLSPVDGFRTALATGREVRIALVTGQLHITYFGQDGRVERVERTHDAVRLANGSVVSLVAEDDPKIVKAMQRAAIEKRPFGFLAYANSDRS